MDVLNVLMRRRQLFLPLQVLGESFHVLVRKGRLDPMVASGMLAKYSLFATVEPYGHDDVLMAMQAVTQHRLSFWDALIWAVCEREGVPILLTEDMQDGRVLGSVTFLNPFSDQAASLLGI